MLFMPMCIWLTEGKILGYAIVDEFECELMISQVIKAGEFPNVTTISCCAMMRQGKFTAKSNLCLCGSGKLSFYQQIVTVVPIMGGGKRLGTLLLARFAETFSAEDLILAETGATVVGIKLRKQAEKVKKKPETKR